MYIEDYIGIQVIVDDKEWYFTNQIDGTYYFVNYAGKYTKINDVEKSNLFPAKLMSGRGGLWNFIIPKLKNYIVLGNGSNTFIFAYPQDSYVYKKYVGTESVFDVKAHSFYFQQFVENGLLALMLVLVFYMIYFVQSFMLYRKIENHSFTSMLGLGIMLGTFDYMIIGLANDSNVNTAPMFWILLGTGMAVNQIVKNNQKQKNV